MQHLKSLDGIRAVAVGIVMLFHFGYFAPGWIGVQAFFVLSGYLITGILLQAKNRSFADYISTFYWNRALRIFPLLFAYIAVSGIAYFLFGTPSSFKSDWPWLVSFSANFARMRPEDLGPAFVHIWSLAVEQQFYIVWPLVVFFVPRKGFKLLVLAMLILTPLLRLAIVEFFTYTGFGGQYAGKAAYVLPVAQFDAFAAGAAISLFELNRLTHAGRWFASIAGITAIAGFAVLITAYIGSRSAFIASFGYAMYLRSGYGYVWGYSLLNILFMLGIICALQGLWPTRFLQSKGMTRIGKISYGIYVYHLPLLILGSYLCEKMGMNVQGPLRPVFFAAWVSIVMLVSDQSYRWLETPFLKLKKRSSALSHEWCKAPRSHEGDHGTPIASFGTGTLTPPE
jgi:peptidoglycan/LPS O-acetylase OafA/YrhL